MINFFLKAKHWQLFLLIFGIPFILQSIMMRFVFSSFSNGVEPDFIKLLSYAKIIPLIIILIMVVYFGWFLSVGVGLGKKIPENLKLKLIRLKLSLLFPFIYMFFFLILMIGLMNGIGALMENTELNDLSIKIVDQFEKGIDGYIFLLKIIFPLHLISGLCIIYSLYFVAKTIKTAELQREVDFSDFIGEFFLIWFFPIGIWFIQPTINKMAEPLEPIDDNNSEMV